MKATLMLPLLLASATSIQANDFYNMSNHLGDVVDGRPLEQYANRWWQWTYSVPPNVSPVRDLNGEHCHQGQSGSVWFLAGGYGSSTIKRECTIPAGQSIFFPVINMVYFPSNSKPLSCDEAKVSAAMNNDQLLTIQIDIDGISAIDPAHTRLSSPECFDLYGMIPKEYGAPERYPAASDGYWVMLKPLSKGVHNLKFSASYGRPDKPFGEMAQDIEYVLTVE